ncbi:MAG: hypothetical protein Q9159_003147 [Coniocarpon cinnabarinum]
MWSGSPAIERKEAQPDQGRIPLHNTEEHVEPIEEVAESDSTRVPSRTGQTRPESGLWGERDVGGPVNETQAREDFETLRRELTNLSTNNKSTTSLKSKKSAKSLKSKQSKRSLSKVRSHPAEARRVQSSGTVLSKETDGKETEDGDFDEEAAEEEEDFALDDFMREGHFEKRSEGHSAKRIGVVYKHLTVKGIGTAASFVRTVPDAVLGTFGPDLYNLLCRFFPVLRFGQGQLRTLVNDFTGVVRDGEMLLVLGRPGAGCSTFLKALANDRKAYAQVTGDVSYGGIPADKQREMYRGEVNYNPEDDVHMPNLNVWQTFVFALLNKTRKREKGEIPTVANALMRMFGISHTRNTLVGNEFVRGISGGERKRVSIAETLATKSTVLCWDNSTRGLDASTALDYAKSLRIMTDVSNKATITTLYQAGENIYQQMDKVLVIDDGKCIFQGPANEARQYFIDLGYHAPERQTTADFLTACTDPNERRFRDGFERRAPKTGKELEAAYLNSSHYQRVLREVDSYEKEMQENNFSSRQEFEEAVRAGKSHRTVSKKSPYTVSFPRQVLACARREFWLIAGDTTTLYTKAFVIVANGFIVGSLFYGESLDSTGAFPRGGALFFAILFLGWLQLTELMKAVTGRNVVARQHEYALYRPSAVTIARVLVDFPILLPQVLVFAIIMYFMCSLDVDVSKFFIYCLFVYTTTILLTSLYRMFAALSPAIDDAVRFSGISLNLLIIYTGYVIPKPLLTSQYIWFGWLYYINPLSYSYEAVQANEFANRDIPCNPAQLVPQQVPGGPPIDPAHQSCSLVGSGIDQTVVPGSQYIGSNYSYTRGHLWRNFGVVIAFSVLYILVTAVAMEVFNFAQQGGGAMVFAKNKRSKAAVKNATPRPGDAEKGVHSDDSASSSERTGNTLELEKGGMAETHALAKVYTSQRIFTWENVNYSVPTGQGMRQLLNSVDGYCKPGVMVALMGASGAGKTTLLNTLAQRQFMGVVSGDMLVDGKSPESTFARSTGFCEQMDIHDDSATIREALEFSALLRQDRNIPRKEKLSYVDTVIDLLELNEIQDAVISCLGVEQRKRLTIGVELAARPSLLLFLDEPTSGLDSQSAYSIVRFLRKLAQAGQAILCTVHQPSSVLIQQFDMILALNPGGQTFYWGPVGHEGSAVTKYFADRGFECPPKKNVAEFLLETAAKSRRRADGTKIDWNEEWRKSDEAQGLKDEIQAIKRGRAQEPGPAEGTNHEFAAPVRTQTLELTKRIFRQHWRNTSYWYGKLFSAVLVGIFNGFTFWRLGNSTIDMQLRMFTSFLVLTLPPTVVNAVVPKFFQNMMLWMVREYPSRIYGWFAFTTAQVVGEIPIAIFSSVLYWVLWYWPSMSAQSHDTESSTAGYVFLMVMLFFLFMSSWGQWITAFAPSFTVISNVMPFFFVMFSLFNGVIRPWAGLPVFWRYWMYYVNPSTWWIGGVLAAVLHDVPVICADNEYARFTPPAGQTCQGYAGAFVNASTGYMTEGVTNGQTVCNFCQYNSGDDYLQSLNISAGDKWRDFGIFLVFVFTNYMLVYFFIWSCRVKHWGFGMGYLFGGLGKMWDLMILPFKKLAARRSPSS